MFIECPRCFQHTIGPAEKCSHCGYLFHRDEQLLSPESYLIYRNNVVSTQVYELCCKIEKLTGKDFLVFNGMKACAEMGCQPAITWMASHKKEGWWRIDADDLDRETSLTVYKDCQRIFELTHDATIILPIQRAYVLSGSKIHRDWLEGYWAWRFANQTFSLDEVEKIAEDENDEVVADCLCGNLDKNITLRKCGCRYLHIDNPKEYECALTYEEGDELRPPKGHCYLNGVNRECDLWWGRPYFYLEEDCFKNRDGDYELSRDKYDSPEWVDGYWTAFVQAHQGLSMRGLFIEASVLEDPLLCRLCFKKCQPGELDDRKFI